MKRRNFIGDLALGGSVKLPSPVMSLSGNKTKEANHPIKSFGKTLEADTVIIGGGLGGYASALSLLLNNKIAVEIN